MTNATLATLAVVSALAAFPSASKADGEFDVAAAPIEPVHYSLTCEQAKKSAWLERQMQRTDGDVSPDVPTPAECTEVSNNMLARADDVDNELK